MSNAVASSAISSGSLTKVNSASGSMKRLISQAHPTRSIWQPARVAHFIARAPTRESALERRTPLLYVQAGERKPENCWERAYAGAEPRSPGHISYQLALLG